MKELLDRLRDHDITAYEALAQLESTPDLSRAITLACRSIAIPHRLRTTHPTWRVSTEGLAAAIDGDRVAIGTLYGLEIRDIATAAPLPRFGPSMQLDAVAWSADGSLVGAGCIDGRVFVWRPPGTEALVLAGCTRPIIAIAFDPTARHVYATDDQGVTWQWTLDDATHPTRLGDGAQLGFSPAGSIVLHRSPDGPIACSPDGRYLVDRLGVRSTSGGDRLVQFAPTTELVSWSPGLVVIGDRVWSTLLGTELGALPRHAIIDERRAIAVGGGAAQYGHVLDFAWLFLEQAITEFARLAERPSSYDHALDLWAAIGRCASRRGIARDLCARASSIRDRLVERLRDQAQTVPDAFARTASVDEELAAAICPTHREAAIDPLVAIAIPDDLLDMVYAHACDVAPLCCCGWLGGTPLNSVREATNGAEDPRVGYRFSNTDLLGFARAFGTADAPRIVYSSLGGRFARLAWIDADPAMYPVQHLVVAVEDGRVSEARVYGWDDRANAFVELAILPVRP